MTSAIPVHKSPIREFTSQMRVRNTIALRVLREEAQSLLDLAASLDEAFDAAIDLLLGTEGKVVLTGIGKSGHIARKIAATLASTGTPSFFVHPGEASHGDLGMINALDAVIALSNSGKTKELADTIVFTRRFSIPLIGITRDPDSELAQRSDIALVLPASPEACPMGLAPTTSSTMMLALGDAIAVALLERRGFMPHQFKLFHPGGSLGSKLLCVKDIMHTGEDMPVISPDTPILEAILIIAAKSMGCAGVLQDGKLAGVITDGDLRRNLDHGLPDMTAGEIMSRSPKTIGPKALVEEAVARMNKHKITSLFVVNEQGCPVGIVHLHDCLRVGVK